VLEFGHQVGSSKPGQPLDESNFVREQIDVTPQR
jgi:hypothetical protein